MAAPALRVAASNNTTATTYFDMIHLFARPVVQCGCHLSEGGLAPPKLGTGMPGPERRRVSSVEHGEEKDRATKEGGAGVGGPHASRGPRRHRGRDRPPPGPRRI